MILISKTSIEVFFTRSLDFLTGNWTDSVNSKTGSQVWEADSAARWKLDDYLPRNLNLCCLHMFV